MAFTIDRFVPHMQKIKIGLHITQAGFIFIAWVLTIVYFRQALIYGADIGWFFAMCFLSIPALLYQTLTNRWRHSRKWGHPYAFAAVDIVFTILWLSAWAAVAAWDSGDWCVGACGVASAMVAMGFFVFFFFGLTSAISVYGVIYWRRHGSLPGSSTRTGTGAFVDPDREAFSTANDEYSGVHMSDKDSLHGDNSHGAELPAEHDQFRYDNTAYTGVPTGGYSPPQQGYSPPQRAYSPPRQPEHTDPLAPDTGRVQFPPGNY